MHGQQLGSLIPTCALLLFPYWCAHFLRAVIGRHRTVRPQSVVLFLIGLPPGRIFSSIDEPVSPGCSQKLS